MQIQCLQDRIPEGKEQPDHSKTATVEDQYHRNGDDPRAGLFRSGGWKWWYTRCFGHELITVITDGWKSEGQGNEAGKYKHPDAS